MGSAAVKNRAVNVTGLGYVCDQCPASRNYAKYLLREGADVEKRELLGCLKSRLVLVDKIISLKAD